MVRILGVHGIGNYLPGATPLEAADRIGEWWRRAVVTQIRGGCEVEFRQFYYADRLATDIAQGSSTSAMLSGGSLIDCKAWLNSFSLEEEPSQGRLTSPIRALVNIVASRFDLDSARLDTFVAKFFPEVNRYMSDLTARGAILQALVDELVEFQPDVVIAHSLGSVVAYEALSGFDGRVPTLVTVGSPLAMQGVIYERLVHRVGVPGRPEGVRRWINIADRGDIVAIPLRGVSSKFAGVSADIDDSIGLFDFHRAAGYLRCGVVAAIVACHS